MPRYPGRASWSGLGVLCACGQLIDADAYRSSATAEPDAGVPIALLTQCGGLSYRASSCGECMQGSCCQPATDCANDPVCRATHECYAGCADDACRTACNGKIPYDTPAERALERCLARSCTAQCDVRCGGSLPQQRALAFRDKAGCCDAERALWADDGAYDWRECQSNCFWPKNTEVPKIDQCGCPFSDSARATAEQLTTCAAIRPGPDWSCLGNVSWPVLNDTAITVDAKVVAFVGDALMPGVTLIACEGIDASCSSPLTSEVTTDGLGEARLALARRGPADFFRYLWLRGTTIPETLLYIQSPAPIRQSRRDARSVLTHAMVKDLYNSKPVQQDVTLGSIGVQVWDCSRSLAAGVRIEASPAADVIYGDALGGVDLNLRATSTRGTAFLLNVPPTGSVGLRLVREATGEQVASLGVVVRANAVTIAVVAPAP